MEQDNNKTDEQTKATSTPPPAPKKPTAEDLKAIRDAKNNIVKSDTIVTK